MASVRQAIAVLVVLLIACGGVAAVGHHQRQHAAEHDRPLFHKVFTGASFMFCMVATAILLVVVQHFMNVD
ncbi:MAG TPA: hypothetical protein V6C69_17215 [Trichormus sp.]|jgi:hypothetical protein